MGVTRANRKFYYDFSVFGAIRASVHHRRREPTAAR